MSELSKLMADLDGVFSRWIRKRDTFQGKVICFICGKRMDFIDSECGHFIPRNRITVRYDEYNCHAVCPECNKFDDRHPQRYYNRMLEVYGKGTIDRLLIKSRGLQKLFPFEVKDLIQYYKSENRQMK